MDYHLTGTFIESCDCFVICPCWVEEDADEGHCTGLVAWQVARGSTIGGLNVGGLSVACVTVHGAVRRGGTSRTLIYVDTRASVEQSGLLARAFAGELGGPLEGLATVSGDVLGTESAEINVTGGDDGWTVQVRPHGSASDAVSVAGSAKFFDDAAAPMSLANSALAAEFGLGASPATSQKSETFRVAVAALPGGYVDVTGRSGMTGAFSYSNPEPIEPPEPVEEAPDDAH